MKQNIESLKEFLIDSNKAGYAGGDEKKWIKESDGSTTIPFEKGPWKSHDNFFGGEPYGGRIVVSYEQKAIWMMVYYGWVKEGTSPDLIYGVLREALKNMPEDYPYRGPSRLEKDELVYENTWIGEPDNYSGEERITQSGALLYKANYLGGWVDKRAGV